jgi:hypothetical protein
MIESCPIKVTFETKQKVTGLNVVTSLDAANKIGEAAIEVVTWNIQIATGPRSAEVATDVKS